MGSWQGFVVMAKGPREKRHKQVSKGYEARSAADDFMKYWKRLRPDADCYVTEKVKK